MSAARPSLGEDGNVPSIPVGSAPVATVALLRLSLLAAVLSLARTPSCRPLHFAVMRPVAHE